MAVILPRQDPYAGLREGLLQAVFGWVEGMKQRKEAEEMSLLGQALRKGENITERQWKTPRARRFAEMVMLEQMRPEELITIAEGEALVTPRGEERYVREKKVKAQRIVVKPGESVIDETGKKIYSLPAEAEKAKRITVSPGQTVIDETGREIYKAPAAPPTTAEKSENIEKYKKGIDQVLKKYNKGAGITIDPTTNTIQIGAAGQNAYDAMKERAKTEPGAKKDLANVDFWYKRLSDLIGAAPGPEPWPKLKSTTGGKRRLTWSSTLNDFVEESLLPSH